MEIGVWEESHNCPDEVKHNVSPKTHMILAGRKISLTFEALYLRMPVGNSPRRIYYRSQQDLSFVHSVALTETLAYMYCTVLHD